MSFRSGSFDREGVSANIRRFCPVRAVDSVTHITSEELVHLGKSGVLLDADNTLLPWRSEELPEGVLNWIASLKSAGIKLCLISNTRNVARLERLSTMLEIPYALGKFKPSREKYEHALKLLSIDRDQAVMIGDQLLTDVLGANRSGIDSILVKPMGTHEFVGTKVNRIWERALLKRLHESLIDSNDDLPIVEPTGVFQSRVVRQFFKFCIVGGSSFVIDYCIRMTLQFQAELGGGKLSDTIGAQMKSALPTLFTSPDPKDAFWPVACAAGAAIAIVNSFIWNRLWTFGIKGRQDSGGQFARFILISVVGLVLNVLISSVLNHFIPGDPKQAARIATFVAAGVVAIWNFLGQRLYAFRAHRHGLDA